jgi:hypothetical protein
MEDSTTPQPPATARPRLLESISARIYRAELTITGIESDPVILAALEPMGYSAARRTEGKNLLAAALSVLTLVEQARASQKTLTQKVLVAQKTARGTYSDLARVGRAIFKSDPAALAHLGLDKGRVPVGTAAFLRTADQLFANALSAPQAVKDRLAEFGYTARKLNDEKAKIDVLHSANQLQEQAKGTAQNLTPQQQATLKALDEYVVQLRKISRVALKQKPQLLEKLGVKA